MGKKQNDKGVTPMGEDISAWYNELVLKAELADRGPAKGSMVMRPYGYTIWELLQRQLDDRFKATGHVNAMFPALIPESYILREADHVEGFAPELYTVTRVGTKELDEPLILRPTSETVIGELYAKWINSYRDLPILINQWCNVFRYELRPRIFLRTTEFLWQEGHTAHANADEAIAETVQMHEVYAEFALNVAAIPCVKGEKTEGERFAGAERTLTIEAMMRDGKALQAGTSHYMGTNFATAFDMTFQDENNELQLCHTTSWGMSTRMIGAIILAHGDDKGLVLPPRIAPIQVVIVPMGRGDDAEAVIDKANELADAMRADGVRVQVDVRASGPGAKFAEWELKGVPFRVELGPRDLAAGHVLMAKRTGETDEKGWPVKETVTFDDLTADMPGRLDAYHDELLARAQTFRDEHTSVVDDWAAFEAQVADGFAEALHCGEPACEDDIKSVTAATPRAIHIFDVDASGSCVRCGKPSAYGKRVTFSRAY